MGTAAAIREGELPPVGMRCRRCVLNSPDHICCVGCVALTWLRCGTTGLAVLGDEQGMAVVGKLVAAQAVVFAKASMDPLSRQAAREAAEEAVSGSYVSTCPVDSAVYWVLDVESSET